MGVAPTIGAGIAHVARQHGIAAVQNRPWDTRMGITLAVLSAVA